MQKQKKYTSKLRSRNGYTLIELMIVMILLVIVGTMIAGILSSTITGTAKSRIASDLAQNGNYALSIISDLILNAQDLQSVTDSTATTYTTCNASGIPAKSLQLANFDGGVVVLKCDDIGVGAQNTISSNSASLIDTSRVKVVPGSCSFTCIQADEYSIPRIDVAFQLSTSTDSATLDTVTFSTSVSMRNQILK